MRNTFSSINFDKILIAYLAIFFVCMTTVGFFQNTGPDEGTHSTLSMFYRDLITAAVKNMDFSFNSAYKFGMSYLAHYPKLQVFYPPSYHIITGLVFYNLFGVSIIVARLCNLIFLILSLIIFYYMTKKIFDPKSALLGTIFFSLFPITLSIGRKAMMEFVTMFFLLLSILIYQKTLKSKKLFPYILTSFFVFMSVMSKRAAVFAAPIFSLHILQRRKLKELFIFTGIFTILVIPYALLIWKIGGLGISQTIYQRYAFEEMAWTFFLEFPFLLIFLIIFLLFVYRSDDKSKLFLGIWFSVFFVGVVFLSFKARYFIYFSIPLFMVAGKFFSKLKPVWIVIFLLVYSLVAVYITAQTFHYYPIKPILEDMYEKIPEGGNVAMFSESGKLYSSAFIFHFAELDVEKELFFYRPCLFSEKDGAEILEFLEENNIYYVIAVPGESGYEKIDLVDGSLEKIGDGAFEVYTFRDFEYKRKEKHCNYVCLTEEEICTKWSTPFAVYSNP